MENNHANFFGRLHLRGDQLCDNYSESLMKNICLVLAEMEASADRNDSIRHKLNAAWHEVDVVENDLERLFELEKIISHYRHSDI